MLLDAKGMIRAEGLIRAIYLDVPKPYLELESGIKIIIKTIRAINGFFHHDFLNIIHQVIQLQKFLCLLSLYCKMA
jgi:hypothetical protein